ncbi:MAG: ankyrin repeat domain-containing protein [Acidobacteriota bacterium]
MRLVATALAAGILLALPVAADARQPAPSPVARAAEARDLEAVRRLVRQGGDVNAAQGDGMTALHWAAVHGDAEMASLLLVAGANPRATTRLGAFTPLHLAAQGGHAAVAARLIAGGAEVDAESGTGATPLMHAAASGSRETTTALIENGAAVDRRERAHGQTALMFAAARNRADVVRLLLARGADAAATSTVEDLAGLTTPEDDFQQNGRPPGAEAPAAAAPAREVPGVTRAFTYNELIGKHGGLSALHFAAREGALETVRALVEARADVNLASPGDRATPLLVAAINGHFDIAAYLLDHGADPTLASEAGVTPLYAVVNVQWQPRSFYPQPRAHLQQQATYLELMTKLLDKGADPNARVNRKTWYMQYNFDLLRIDDAGATPFWRAAYASDLDAMRLLVARGADPGIPTMRPAGGRRFDESTRSTGSGVATLAPIPVAGPGIPPLLAAAGVGYGEGFAGNAHRFAPTGMLAAVRYLVEELGADVNAVDSDGNTALHHAAARGDNEMILYLVGRGADVGRVNRRGQTTVDMANGPVQRIQPFPETIKLLESLGARNSHKCVSC